MVDLNDFGAGIDTDSSESGTVHFRRHDCRAITGGSNQCQNTPITDDKLCTVHEDSYRVRRVDEFASGPADQLNTALKDECGIGGRKAYALATVAEDIEGLWNQLTTPEEAPLEVGDNTHSFSAMVNTAANVAEHPMLSVDDSLFAQQNCVALTSKDERCSYGADGVLRLCHTHRDVEDLTVIDEFSDTVAELRADDTVPTRL